MARLQLAPGKWIKVLAIAGFLLTVSVGIGAIPAQAKSQDQGNRYSTCVDSTSGRGGQASRGNSPNNPCGNSGLPTTFSNSSVIRTWAQTLINNSLQGYAFGDQHCGDGLYVVGIDVNGAVQCLGAVGGVSTSSMLQALNTGPVDLAAGSTVGGNKIADVLDVQQEADARATADQTLLANINAEAAVRTAGDNQLQTSVDNEQAARIASDTQLQGNVDAEAAARDAADKTLQANIDTEAQMRKNGDDSLVQAFNMFVEQLFAAMVPNNQSCQPGSVVSGFDSTGMVVCQPAAPSPTLSYQRVEQTFTLQANVSTPQTFSATCPTGLKAVGGGYNLSTPSGTDIVPTAAYPGSDTTWSLVLPGNPTASDIDGTVTAVCVALQ